MAQPTNRRRFIAQSLLGAAAGSAAAYSLEENGLLAALEGKTNVSPEEKAEATRTLMPRGKIGDVDVSRLILGSNLIAGFAHSRDLLYVSQLFKRYNTEERIFDTFALAEQCGVNAILTNPVALDHVVKYNQQRKGKLKPIVYVRPYPDAKQTKEEVSTVVDKGASAITTHGNVTDQWVRRGELEPIGRALDIIKQHGVPAGLGCHSLETPKASEKNSLGAEFYHKTFHIDRYWSATPEDSRKEWCWYEPTTGGHDDYNDNMFCLNAEETAEFMAGVKKPWIAFKVLAAGAIHPRVGFSHAFRNGADIVCCGMFDFQVCEDVKIAKSVLEKTKNRRRPWMA